MRKRMAGINPFFQLPQEAGRFPRHWYRTLEVNLRTAQVRVFSAGCRLDKAYRKSMKLKEEYCRAYHLIAEPIGLHAEVDEKLQLRPSA
jgi:hypothetical protein